jgi:hypothetical protein
LELSRENSRFGRIRGDGRNLAVAVVMVVL